ncbi:hypothetical protein ABIE41_003550 [Bosea sp. OAE506]|uniref:hypothetical protein n=1 Tax=Bosea sp. OAE506 TaxID=2663870 RepID=UPI00178B14FA
MVTSVLGGFAGMVAGGGLFYAGCYLAWRNQWFGAVDAMFDFAWNGWIFAVFLGGLLGSRAVQWLGLVQG